MDYAYRMYKNVKYFYNTINPATLSGAIDVIVVEQPDGELKSTPFHVRFGKYGVFSHYDKFLDISVNGDEIDLKMKLGENGVAFFVEETEDKVPEYMVTSPLPGGSQPETGKVLAESVKELHKHQMEQEKEGKGRTRVVSECSEASGSRSPSPSAAQRKHQKEEEESARRKRAMAFTPSMFSQRRNRSMPDLSTIHDANCGYHSDGESKGECTKKKNPKCLRHSKSQALDKRSTSMKGAKAIDDQSDILAKLAAESNQKEGKPARPAFLGHRRKRSRVNFVQPPPVRVDKDESSSDSELDSSASSVSPSPSLLDPADAERIADGALSDSEVDRHRNTPEPHGSDVTDWKWGELPETRDEAKRKEKEKQREAAAQPVAAASSWWPWRSRAAPAAEEGVYLDDLVAGGQDKMEKYLGKANSSGTSADSGRGSIAGTTGPSSPVTVRSYDDSFDKTPTQESVTEAATKGADEQRVRHASDGQRSSGSEIFPLSEDEDEHNIRYIRSLRLSSDRLKSLRLSRGANEARFSITTKFQGTTWCQCNIYLFKWYDKIVISDVDGTITKSDVLGHVIPAIGGTWAHAGVAELYTGIKNNGYKIIYLSSRAIGQSHTTKQYLRSVAQDSKVLPDGPVLLSPTSVLMAFRREVIERRPEEFKIAALTDLMELFPVKQPFFAGFGNRETDVTSYRAVGIPHARILIIDSSGKVRRADSVGLVSSYLSMASETVDYLFPPLSRKARYFDNTDPIRSSFSKPLEHSSFTHWRDETASEAAVDDEDLKVYEAKRRADKLRHK